MNVSELWVRRPVTGVMVFLALTLVGVVSFLRLQLDLMPEMQFPIIAVITQYPGASAESIEQLVSRPIEQAVTSVEHVEDVMSTSSQGSSLVMVNFSWGTDMDKAEQDVRKNLEIYAQDVLPDDAKKPLSFAFDISLMPVVFMTVNAPGTPTAVRKLAEDEVSPFLERIPGVASAEVLGGTKREIQVRLRPEWLQTYRVSPQQVVGALRGANVLLAGGTLDQGAQELALNTDAEVHDLDQVRRIVVGQRGAAVIHLEDVADVVDTFEEQSYVVRTNGVPSVMIAVRKQSDANTVQVAHRVLKESKELEQRLPEGATLTTLFDQSEPITRSLSNLASTALLALLFTALVLLAFLRSIRTSVIVLVSIPLSMLATFVGMDATRVTLNTVSMAGLALAVGMLVDNSIVVLENIFRHLDMGAPPSVAAVRGTKEVSMPITASTLTTVAVFAPVLFVPGIAGQLFRDMSLTICLSLATSLVVTLTLVPLMASQLLGRGGKHRFELFLARLTRWIDPLSDRYGNFLLGALSRHRGKIMGGAAAFFVVTMALGGLLGVDFMPKNDQGRVVMQVETAPGNSVETTNQVFRRIEDIVEKGVPEAVAVVSQFGSSAEGFSALSGQSSYKGTLQVRLKPLDERSRSQFDVEAQLRAELNKLPGVEAKVQPRGMSAMSGGGDLTLKVFGDDLRHLRHYGQRLTDRLKTVPGASDVVFSMEEGRPELKIEFDRTQAEILGLSQADLSATVSTYFLGTKATVFRDEGDEFAVLVRAPRSVREDIVSLQALPIVTPAGGTVPLASVANIGPALGPTSIKRENQRRLATIDISADGVSLGTLMERVQAAIDEQGREPGITTELGGTAEDLKDSFKALALAILAAVFLVYMVMASQFESLLEPFVILLAVPMALTGVVLGLLVTRTTLQVTALIGLVLLAGVVVNNGIVLLDVLKQRRQEGMDPITAAVDAGRNRLRPILMTTLTTVLGMLPLAIGFGEGSEIWAPMARAVIGGMTLSTVLTLVVVPTVYVAIAIRRDRRRERKNARKLTSADEATRRGAVA